MKLNRTCFILVILGILVFFLYLPRIYQGYHRLEKLKIDLVTVTLESERLEKEATDLKLELENFDNLFYIEKYARNKLAMKKPNESIYRVIYEEDSKE